MMKLSACSWNVNGIRKLKNIFSRPRQTVRDPDIICLQETWATTELEQLSVSDYVAFHAPALPSNGPRGVGGVSTYFKIDSFVAGCLVKLPSPVWWALTVRWEVENGPGLVVINVYAAMHTAGVQPKDFETLFDFVNDMRCSHGADEVIVLGDLNSDRFRRRNPVRREEQLILSWLQHMESNGYRVVPDKPTVTFLDASTTLDYRVLPTGGGLALERWYVDESLNCQHLPVIVDLTLGANHSSSTVALTPRLPNLRFTKNAISTVRELLLVSLDNLAGLPAVEVIYDCILDSFVTCGHARTSRPVNCGASWWRYVPEEQQQLLRGLENDAQFLAREWADGRATFSVSEIISFRRELNRVSALCRQMAEEAILKEMRVQFPNHALCWKVLRKLRSPDQSVAIDIGTLQRHFSAIFHCRDRPLFHVPDPVEGWGETLSGDVHFDVPFTDHKLQRALKDLNGQAGTGPERVPSQTIKDVFSDSQVRPILLLLMNACFQEGVLPSAWGLAELFVLFKGKGLPTVSDNYRVIALSNDFRRIFERLVQARLSAWSRLNNATGSMQFGFKSGSGTLEAIFVLRSFMFFVTRILQVPGYAVFIDLRKAFPTLSRTKTLEVLKQKRVPKKITQAVATLMSGTVQRLRVNGKLTDSFPVTSGTPEGSINSPEIFAIVYKAVLQKLDIHELPTDFRLIERGKVYYIVFADDLSLFSLDLQPLEERTNEFDTECVDFHMKLNRAKSKWMAFLPETAPPDLPERSQWKISVGGELLENVEEFVYLGFKLDVKLNDNAHTRMVKERYIRAAQVTGQLMRDLQCVNLLNLRQFFLSRFPSALWVDFH